jgi:hypothetical protein
VTDLVSHRSGDEPKTTGARTDEEVLVRRRAATAGRATERLVASALDKLESLSLWALEQAAEVHPGGDRLRTADQRLNRLRSLAAPFPRTAGRVVAGSTYFGCRWAPEVTRAAKRILSDTSAFLDADPEAQDD